MAQRRYYVLSDRGELGPHNRLELRDLLRGGRIAADDRLRTAFGADAGTVAALLADPEASSYGNEAVEISEPIRTARRQRSRAETVDHDGGAGDEITPDEAGDRGEEDIAEPHGLPIVTITLSALLASLLIGWWWLGRGARQQADVERTIVASMPLVTISGEDASWLRNREGGFTVRVSQALAAPLTVPLAIASTAVAGVDFVTLPSVVEIPAGAFSARVVCVPFPATCGRRPAVALTVGLLPGPGHQVGNPSKAQIILHNDELLPGEPAVTWLSDLPFASRWNSDHEPMINRSDQGNPLILKRVTYAKGLGTHAGVHGQDPEAHVTYELGGNYAEFLTDIGIDDEAPPGSSATFQVWIDGQPEFDSGIMQAQSPVRHLRIGVAGAKILKLVVTDGGNGNLGDNTDWAGARLIAK